MISTVGGVFTENVFLIKDRTMYPMAAVKLKMIVKESEDRDIWYETLRSLKRNIWSGFNYPLIHGNLSQLVDEAMEIVVDENIGGITWIYRNALDPRVPRSLGGAEIEFEGPLNWLGEIYLKLCNYLMNTDFKMFKKFVQIMRRQSGFIKDETWSELPDTQSGFSYIALLSKYAGPYIISREKARSFLIQVVSWRTGFDKPQSVTLNIKQQCNVQNQYIRMYRRMYPQALTYPIALPEVIEERFMSDEESYIGVNLEFFKVFKCRTQYFNLMRILTHHKKVGSDIRKVSAVQRAMSEFIAAMDNVNVQQEFEDEWMSPIAPFWTRDTYRRDNRLHTPLL